MDKLEALLRWKVPRLARQRDGKRRGLHARREMRDLQGRQAARDDARQLQLCIRVQRK